MTHYLCDNCGHIESAPPEARDLSQRLDENGEYTDRECSKCGSLTYESIPDAVADLMGNDMTRSFLTIVADRMDCQAIDVAFRLLHYGEQNTDYTLYKDFFGPVVDALEDIAREPNDQEFSEALGRVYAAERKAVKS